MAMYNVTPEQMAAYNKLKAERYTAMEPQNAATWQNPANFGPFNQTVPVAPTPAPNALVQTIPNPTPAKTAPVAKGGASMPFFPQNQGMNLAAALGMGNLGLQRQGMAQNYELANQGQMLDFLNSNANRATQLNLAGMQNQLGRYGIDASAASNLAGLKNDFALGSGNLNLGFQTEADQAALQNNLQNNQYALGVGGLQNDRYGMESQFELGIGNLQNQQLGLNQEYALGAGGLQNQRYQTDADVAMGQYGLDAGMMNNMFNTTSNNALGKYMADLERQNAQDQAAIENQQVANQLTLGQGGLANEAMGLQNQLTLGQGGLSNELTLGQGKLSNEAAAIANQLALGQGGLSNELTLGKGSLENQRYGYDTTRYGMDKEYELGKLGIGLKGRLVDALTGGNAVDLNQSSTSFPGIATPGNGGPPLPFGNIPRRDVWNVQNYETPETYMPDLSSTPDVNAGLQQQYGDNLRGKMATAKTGLKLAGTGLQKRANLDTDLANSGIAQGAARQATQREIDLMNQATGKKRTLLAAYSGL